MVFDPGAAPADRATFLTWYDEQTQWSESHGYDDPMVSEPKLRSWFMDMIKVFPAMSGPYSDSGADESSVADYSVGRSVIYVAFSRSEVEAAYKKTFMTAQKHHLGFFDVNVGSGDLWLPNPGTGRLRRVHFNKTSR